MKLAARAAVLSVWLCLLLALGAAGPAAAATAGEGWPITATTDVSADAETLQDDEAAVSPTHMVPDEALQQDALEDGVLDDRPVCTGDHEMLNRFAWEDYSVLAAMLIISVAIGMFYGFFSGGQKTSEDFLLGGSTMGTFPMAMSLAASFITAIELLGNPAEMYSHGTQFWMTCCAFLVVIPIASRFYVPVFMTLRLTSSYEYLEMRFNWTARLMASALYVLQMVLYTSVAVYAPALALSHVTGLNTYVAVSLVYLVCVFYSSQGGMKAVIMTDTFQAAVLIGSILLILGIGDHFQGGPSVIWDLTQKSERIEFFNLDPNPTTRHSLWSVVIGGSFYWLSMFCANQASIQKYLSVESLAQVRSALWVSAAFLIGIFTVNFYMGAILYAEYRDCDPVQSHVISASDQLLPLYVMNALGHFKGLPGFFVAGIFAASLGTVASALNSLTAVMMQDFLDGALGIKVPAERGAFWSKWISVMFGVLSFALVFVVEQLGSVLQVALSFNGMVGGVVLGLFTLGMFFPWANAKGAVVGSVTALALVLWIGLGAQVAIANNALDADLAPTSTAGCPCTVNATASPGHLMSLVTAASQDDCHDSVFVLYRLSYLWYTMLGTVVTVVVGMAVSALTTFQDPCALHPDLLAPPVRNFLGMLPNSVKELLNLPIEDKSPKERKVSKMVVSDGVINVALTLDDEKGGRLHHALVGGPISAPPNPQNGSTVHR
ncbi:sodium-coupled monocarboxylate transporter 1-like [Thrips palmi]|uniref:Sodium-coupled monocarboxylate transporter 1-like n=1 Tax=Thrips palmi TaxID=161013 RepID=A0A6P8YHW1_THRPL|nr:sodium-coupled monocarboxylate transporter 1-like [Thrips palmi]